MYDILIKNGTVIDGTGKTPVLADVGIAGGLITDIGLGLRADKAERVIDAKDHYVTPGFIDIQNHSDSYWTLFDQPEQKSLLAQGITTIVTGNCGSSLAPLTSPESLKTIQKWHNLSGINVNWSSFHELLEMIAASPRGVNVAGLVGHATLRRGILGDQPRLAKPEEISVMESLLQVALNEGGMGLSMGLVYAHEVDSGTEELLRLTRHLKKSDKYLSIHLRSEGGAVLDAVDEAINLAAKCEVPVKISHLKVRGRKNWHNFDRVVSKLENAYHQGINVTFDAYPYSSSWSVLYTYLPRWAYEGGRNEILRRLADATDRRKILDYLKGQDYDYGMITVATAEGHSGFQGKTIRQIAANQATSNEEAMLNLIAASQTQVIVFDHNLNEEHVELFLSNPLGMVATDGAGYNSEVPELVHPRCFGTMPRFLKMVREKRIMRWEQAIPKMTSEPARLLGLNERGTLKKGAAADVVVFDPLSIQDRATYDHPFGHPIGINSVMVNGRVAWDANQFVGSFGKVIRR